MTDLGIIFVEYFIRAEQCIFFFFFSDLNDYFHVFKFYVLIVVEC